MSIKPKPTDTKSPAAKAAPDVSALTGVIDDLKLQMELITDRLEVSDIEKIELQETIANLKLGLDEREATGEVIERGGEIVFDPYDSHDPFAIIGAIPVSPEFPEGQTLAWKSPDYRKRRGWRGWIPVEYGDKYAGKDNEFLSNYIVDPPERMVGPDQIDNCVRRGDLVLSWIDSRIWDERQTKRELLAKRRQIAAGSGATQILRDGVEITGPGRKAAKNPRKEFGIPKAPDAVRTQHPVCKTEE